MISANQQENSITFEKDQKEQELSVSAIYDRLKELEKIPANPTDVIKTNPISSDDFEYNILIDIGVTPEELKSGKISRAKLLEANFIFNNQPILFIEKSLLNFTFNGVNFGSRKFILKEELDAIIAYQRTKPEIYGSDEIVSDDFRKELLSLLLSTHDMASKINRLNEFTRAIALLAETSVNISFSASRKKSQSEIKKDLYKKSLFELFFEETMKDYQDSYGNFSNKKQEFINNYLQEFFVFPEPNDAYWRLQSRGKQMRTVASRRSKFNNMFSPFLDSGFIFPEAIGNPDLTVRGSHNRLFRLNIMVWHLASRGISEMGEGIDGKGDQDYTIGNYIRDLHIVDKDEREEMLVEENKKYEFAQSYDYHHMVIKLQQTLVDLALDWAKQQPPDSKAAKLLNEIERMPNQNLATQLFENVKKRLTGIGDFFRIRR